MGAQNEKYTGDDVLQVMSKYAVNRNNAVERLIRLRLDASPQKLLEVGAGRGEFINRFTKDQAVETYIIETDADYYDHLTQTHQGFRSTQDVPDSFFDIAYLIDVLEHIEDDQGILTELHRILKPGGKLLIYVPARMELYSPFDKRIGHFRRYHKPELTEKMKAADFNLEAVRYHDVIGYFAAYYNKFFSKKGVLNPKMVDIYDRYLFPITDKMERVVKFPIGKSLYAIGEKTKEV